MPQIGTPELVVILVVVFLLFGAKRMPDMARGIGQSLKIFKTEMSRPADEDTAGAVVANPPPASAAPTQAPAAPTQASPAPAQAPAAADAPEPRPAR